MKHLRGVLPCDKCHDSNLASRVREGISGTPHCSEGQRRWSAAFPLPSRCEYTTCGTASVSRVASPVIGAGVPSDRSSSSVAWPFRTRLLAHLRCPALLRLLPETAHREAHLFHCTMGSYSLCLLCFAPETVLAGFYTWPLTIAPTFRISCVAELHPFAAVGVHSLAFRCHKPFSVGMPLSKEIGYTDSSALLSMVLQLDRLGLLCDRADAALLRKGCSFPHLHGGASNSSSSSRHDKIHQHLARIVRSILLIICLLRSTPGRKTWFTAAPLRYSPCKCTGQCLDEHANLDERVEDPSMFLAHTDQGVVARL